MKTLFDYIGDVLKLIFGGAGLIILCVLIIVLSPIIPFLLPDDK